MMAAPRLLQMMAGMLGLAVAAEIAWPASEQHRPVAPPPPSVASAAASRPDQTGQETELILARPLFTPGRRPPAQAAVQASRTVSTPLPRLSGIVIAGPRSSAIFENGDKRESGGVGGRVGDWRILAIAPWRVTLQGPGGIRTVGLAYGGETQGAAPAPPSSMLDVLNDGQSHGPTQMPPRMTLQQMMATLPQDPMAPAPRPPPH